jgi:uncharacterized membrane protein YfcA
VAISRSIILLLTGIVDGLMNAIAGGGTIVTFPALISTGISFGVGFDITAVMFYKQIVRSWASIKVKTDFTFCSWAIYPIAARTPLPVGIPFEIQSKNRACRTQKERQS